MGYIYRIYSTMDETQLSYIGSTIKSNLKYRLTEHKSEYFRPNRNKQMKSCILFDRFGIDTCVIESLEEFNGTKKDLLIREQQYLDSTTNKINTNHSYLSDDDRKLINRANCKKHYLKMKPFKQEVKRLSNILID